MSNLHTCTSTTRPTNPTQGDMLFETDSDQLILYYNGAWLSFGASAQAASTVLNIDLGVGSTSDLVQYFSDSFTGDWGVDTSLNVSTALQIKHTRGVFRFLNPAFDASHAIYSKQLTLGAVNIGISLDTSAHDTTYSDANSSAITIVSPHDILTTSQTKNNHNAIYVTHSDLIVDDPTIKASNNIIMQTDIETVTSNMNYPAGTVVNSTLQTGDSHIGFAGDSEYGRSKDVVNGIIHINDTTYSTRPGTKSYVSKTYRDTQNTLLSAGPAYHGVGSGLMENNSNDHVNTIWFKLSATDPLVETSTTRYIYGLGGHCSLEAVSAADGSGWYLNLDEIGTPDPVIPTPELKLEEDTWYNVTLSVTGGPPATDRDIRLYLDGQLVHTSDCVRGTYIRHIGTVNASFASDTQVLNGTWTGFAAWDQPLNENQINLISNNTNLNTLIPNIPEPYNWIHPLNDPFKLLGMYDSQKHRIEPIVLENKIHNIQAQSTNWKQTSIDAGQEPFPSDVVIYSEEHPTK